MEKQINYIEELDKFLSQERRERGLLACRCTINLSSTQDANSLAKDVLTLLKDMKNGNYEDVTGKIR